MRSIHLALALAGLALPATAIALHNHLIKSTPTSDETVGRSPKEVRLWFAEKVQAQFSSIGLLAADSSKIEIGKAHATDDPLSIAADVTKPLAAGKYTVVWRTAGDDGHAVRGRFAFTVGK